MKKMIVTIIILFIIFISMVIFKNIEKSQEIKVDEINKIEKYVEKIYGWKEITDEALPEFNDINNVNEKWIWGIVRENIEDIETDYETIEKTAKELYGDSFQKKFPTEGNEFISYDNDKQKYTVKQTNLDAINDSYLLNKIERIKDGYTVEIVEYLVDFTNEDNGNVQIKNLQNEKIYELTAEDATESNIKKVVKENISRFNKKKIFLKNNNDSVIITKVEKE